MDYTSEKRSLGNFYKSQKWECVCTKNCQSWHLYVFNWNKNACLNKQLYFGSTSIGREVARSFSFPPNLWKYVFTREFPWGSMSSSAPIHPTNNLGRWLYNILWISFQRSLAKHNECRTRYIFLQMSRGRWIRLLIQQYLIWPRSVHFGTRARGNVRPFPSKTVENRISSTTNPIWKDAAKDTDRGLRS